MPPARPQDHEKSPSGQGVASGGSVSDLGNVPLTFRQGAAICAQHDTCGDWNRYDLEVLDNGGWTRLPHGATLTLGGYRVIHGGVAEQVSAAGCPDWYVADVHVAVIRDAT